METIKLKYFHVVDDNDACNCKRPVTNPPSERNRGELRGCGICGKPLKQKFQEEIKIQKFICKGCEHELPIKFTMKTKGYCYLCDPEITVDELLKDAKHIKIYKG